MCSGKPLQNMFINNRCNVYHKGWLLLQIEVLSVITEIKIEFRYLHFSLTH